MTRFYYTDPLAAAWMAKHFGMWFTRESFHITLCDILDSIYEADPAKCYIHPDSMRLLEVNPKTDLTLAGIANAMEAMPPNANRIIQRNGIPFMWPEGEAA